MAVFAALCVAGLGAAYVGPLSAGIPPAQADEIEPVSLFADSIDDAQTFASSAEIDTASLDRGGYTVYVKPKPTPTPEPVVTRPSGSSGGSSSHSAPAAPAPMHYTGGGSASEWMAAAGLAQSDWGYVDYIVQRESGWNPNATNPSSGACGLVQALPCSKVPGNGYDPVDNLRWANGYATGRYGSWAGAYQFWINNHWW